MSDATNHNIIYISYHLVPSLHTDQFHLGWDLDSKILIHYKL